MDFKNVTVKIKNILYKSTELTPKKGDYVLDCRDGSWARVLMVHRNQKRAVIGEGNFSEVGVPFEHLVVLRRKRK